jgi:hypothetical protein
MPYMAKQSACNAMQCNALDILEKQQYLAVPGSTTNTLLEKLTAWQNTQKHLPILWLQSHVYTGQRMQRSDGRLA